MGDAKLVLSELILHLSFVLLKISQSLLKVDVLLSLCGHCLIEKLSIMLDDWYDMLQVIIILGLQVALHSTDFRSICFDEFLVVFQVYLGGSKLILKMFNIVFDINFPWRSWGWLHIV